MNQSSFFQTALDLLIKFWPSLLLGVRTTLIVAILGTLFGFIIGLIVGGIKAIQLDFTSSTIKRILKKVFDTLVSIYIGVFRGTPMMVQAVFIYYALLNVIHWDKMTAAIFVISINTGAYMAEIIRAGIQAVDQGQVEASRSLGLSNLQTMMYIVLPQAIRNVFPAIGNELIVNIKDSSVLMIISITELMFEAKSIAGSTYHFTETYFNVAIIYLILTTIASLLLNAMERKINQTSSGYPQSVTDPKQMKFITKGN